MSGEETDRNERFINSHFLNTYVDNTIKRKMKTEKRYISFISKIFTLQPNIYIKDANNDQ